VQPDEAEPIGPRKGVRPLLAAVCSADPKVDFGFHSSEAALLSVPIERISGAGPQIQPSRVPPVPRLWGPGNFTAQIPLWKTALWKTCQEAKMKIVCNSLWNQRKKLCAN
jgi:hypothetical protein